MLHKSYERVPEWVRLFARLLGVAIPLCCLFTVFNPALIFFQQDLYPLAASFWMNLLGIGLATALGLSVTLLPLQFGLYRWKGRAVTHVAQAFLSACFVVFFFATVFYPQASPLQDGSTATEPTVLDMLSLYIGYGIAIFATTVFALKQAALLRRLAFMAGLFCFGLSTYVAAITVYQESQITYLSEETDLSFGSKKNIIVIVADMLQGTSVEKVLELYPELKEQLPGFTAYTRAISPFPFTSFALPAILSGKVYASDEEVPTFRKNLNAAHADSFITDAQKVGYDLLELGFMHLSHIRVRSENPWELSFEYLAHVIDLSMLRNFRKKFFRFDAFSIRISSEVLKWKEQGAYGFNKLLKQSIGHVENKLIFQHNLLPHAPSVIWEKANGRVTWQPAQQEGQETYIQEIRFFVQQLGDLCSHLQQLGIYNDSLIIIVADHGTYLKYAGITSTDDFDGEKNVFWRQPGQQYNSAIFVKRPGAENTPANLSRSTQTTLVARKIIRKELGLPEMPLENAGIPVVALIDPNAKLSPFFSAASHHLTEVVDGLSSLPALMCDPKRAIIDYTRIAPAQTLPLQNIQTFSGLTAKEPGGAWIHGDRGDMALDLSQHPKSTDAILAFSIEPLVNPQHPMQRLQVEANGTSLVEMRVSTGMTKAQITLPSSILESAQGKILLTFKALDAVSPKILGMWDFDGKVSVFFRDVTLLSN
ncbi:sulfatase-like hydrolase/transferase [Nitratidesulfovibrio liaohensis]|uniref:sulfatase-like hydrolase/transferase n=1 Tax=Nitratidesulfovibrio liaohensis TaxID=2604158 RepID=UPI001422AC50|nr:sulfatase-like hydrolase/transferase [Nitratidesulfovibrio liaohensis]NHZ48033.1 sulfatase-like hydrolase/transferase [Nitratidesulfovibrio liaohensis]